METKEKIKVLILDYSNEINWFPALCNDIIEDSEIIDCSYEQTPWKSKQNERTDIVKELIHFKYRNVDFYYKYNLHDDFPHEEYDYIYTIDKHFFLDGMDGEETQKDRAYIDYRFPKQYFEKQIIFNTEEAIDTSNGVDHDFFKKNDVRLVSCYSDKNLDAYSDNDFIHIPFISFLEFFYDKRYYYLDYNVEIKKKNLIGTYHIEGYKKWRDEFLQKINNYLELKDQPLVKKYSQTIPTKIPQRILEFTFEGWQYNHVTNFMDFGTSVLNIIFETEFNSNKWFTEKTLKALLFSNCTYPILYKNLEDLRWLKDNGYWLLNFEFIDWDKSYDEYHSKIEVEDSILKTLQYVNSIEGSIENKFNELDKRFYTKRNETFTKIMNWLDKPDYRDRLFNFMFKEVFNG